MKGLGVDVLERSGGGTSGEGTGRGGVAVASRVNEAIEVAGNDVLVSSVEAFLVDGS